jgi:peptide deformylase
MAVREILLLGNPMLYQVCEPVAPDELEEIGPVVIDLRDTLLGFRERWGAGRAIAAPQIGVMKRLVYVEIDEPQVLINPVLNNKSAEMVELWDDCMSFPELFVYVRRHARCDIAFLDLNWKERAMALEGDLSELLQHECDHLDGILAVARAVDGRSFALRSQRRFVSPIT